MTDTVIDVLLTVWAISMIVVVLGLLSDWLESKFHDHGH